MDYTAYTLPTENKWLCKAPGPVPPYRNILNVYDIPSWLGILASLVLVGIMFLIIMRSGDMQPDTVQILMTPIAMLSSEHGVPVWVNMRLSGKIMFLTWAMMGMILMLGLQCNLRALLLRVENKEPIESTEDLVKSGKEIWIVDGWWHKSYLSTSKIEWHIKAFEISAFEISG